MAALPGGAGTCWGVSSPRRMLTAWGQVRLSPGRAGEDSNLHQTMQLQAPETEGEKEECLPQSGGQQSPSGLLGWLPFAGSKRGAPDALSCLRNTGLRTWDMLWGFCPSPPPSRCRCLFTEETRLRVYSLVFHAGTIRSRLGHLELWACFPLFYWAWTIPSSPPSARKEIWKLAGWRMGKHFVLECLIAHH